MRARIYIIGCAALLLSGASAAAAEDKAPKTNAEKDRALSSKEVTERDQDGYSAKGLNLGGFTFYPLVEVKERFSDNVYYDQWRRRKDLITTTMPSVRLRSNWDVHEVELYGQIEDVRYKRHDKEDVDNFLTYLAGRLDVTRELVLTAKASLDNGHESRSSPDDRSGVEPTQTRKRTGQATAEWKGPQVRLKWDGTAGQVSYGNGRTDTGEVLNNHDRDRMEYDSGVRVSYQIIPNYFAFVEGRGNVREYLSSLDDNGQNRDSSGWEGRAGVTIELSGVLTGDVYASYARQNYVDKTFREISAPGGGLALTWMPTPLTTVKSSVERRVGETTTRWTGGTLQTVETVSVAHELQRNIVLEADASATQSTYAGTGKHDNLLTFGGRGTYKFNRFVYTVIDYHYSQQFNAAHTGQYTENSMFAKLGVQF